MRELWKIRLFARAGFPFAKDRTTVPWLVDPSSRNPNGVNQRGLYRPTADLWGIQKCKNNATTDCCHLRVADFSYFRSPVISSMSGDSTLIA